MAGQACRKRKSRIDQGDHAVCKEQPTGEFDGLAFEAITIAVNINMNFSPENLGVVGRFGFVNRVPTAERAFG